MEQLHGMLFHQVLSLLVGGVMCGEMSNYQFLSQGQHFLGLYPIGLLIVEVRLLQSLIDLVLADRLSLLCLVLRFTWNWVLCS